MTKISVRNKKSKIYKVTGKVKMFKIFQRIFEEFGEKFITDSTTIVSASAKLFFLKKIVKK